MDNRFYYSDQDDIFLQLRFGNRLLFNQGQVGSFTVDIAEQIRDVTYTRSGRPREQIRTTVNPTALSTEPDGVVEDALEAAMSRALDEAIVRLGVAPNDRLGVTIDGFTTDGVRYQIFVPLRVGLTVDDIMDAIRNKLNSSETLQARMRITFKKVAIILPDVNELEARGKWIPQFNLFCTRKRSLVVINPPGDTERDSSDCFPQFLLIGLAKLFQENQIQNICPSMLNLTTDLYSQLVSNYKLRHELARDLETWLCPTGNNAMLLDAVQNIYHVQVVLHDFSKKFLRTYPPHDTVPRIDELKPLIIGLVAIENEQPHVNYVADIAAFNCSQDQMNYCPHCFTHYKRKPKCSNNCKGLVYCGFCHECSGICGTCMTSQCGALNFSENSLDTSRCNHCNRVTYTAKCRQLHAAVCSSLCVARCIKCSRSKHTGPCDMTRCMICGARVHISELEEDTHQCYLRRSKLKPPQQNYWTFDFECFIHENGTHEIYLATAWCMYSNLYMNSLQRDFPNVQVAGYDNPVFVFWGQGGDDFFSFLNDNRVHDTIFFAHNSGKYDSILLETGMYKKFGYLPEKITRGCKIMSMTFTEINLTIRDSLCFIPTALRCMSENFGIAELKKGYFPHRLLTAAYYEKAKETNFIVTTPSHDFFIEDWKLGGCIEKEQKELETFLDSFYDTNPVTWNLRSDAEAYCISDTLLLGCVLREFREKTMTLTDTIPRHADVEHCSFDCLQYITLPSAVMAFYKSQMLPDNTFAAINRYGCLMRMEGVACVLYWREQMNLSHLPIRWKPVVQGIQVTAQVGDHIFWFLPCYDNGCTSCYSSSYRNIRVNLPMYACRSRLNNQLLLLEQSGLNINIMWEHKWREKKKTFDYNGFKKYYEDEIPLDPRDAYKGGCTEMYKLIVPMPFSISDFVSQYPTMMYGSSKHPVTNQELEWPMPVGQPHFQMYPPLSVLDNPEPIGIIKCRVVPPKHLYAPFLGHKVQSLLVPNSYEILYGLCRLCMEQRFCMSCTHSDEERSFTGTWTIREVYYARSIGYKVVHITEMWIYEKSDTTLFRGFITPFIKAKILARRKGMVTESEQFTPKGMELANYLLEMTGQEVSPNDFQETPALRTIAKLIMNSFYGKWGQRAVWPQSARFYDNEEGQLDFQKLLTRADAELEDVELYTMERNNEEVTILTVQFSQSYAASYGDSKKQDHIAAYVTAYGRQLLHMMVHHVGMDVINTDTDSVAHIYRDPLPYQPGLRLGDFELEVPKGLAWCGGGRKMYIYTLPDGKTVVKQKGVSLRQSMAHIFTRDNMEKMIRDTLSMYDEFTADTGSVMEAAKKWRQLKRNENGEIIDLRPSLDVPQTRFNIVQNGAKMGTIETRTMNKKTRFLREALKRRLFQRDVDGVTILDTLPFGFVDQ